MAKSNVCKQLQKSLIIIILLLICTLGPALASQVGASCSSAAVSDQNPKVTIVIETPHAVIHLGEPLNVHFLMTVVAATAEIYYTAPMDQNLTEMHGVNVPDPRQKRMPFSSIISTTQLVKEILGYEDSRLFNLSNDYSLVSPGLYAITINRDVESVTYKSNTLLVRILK